MQSLRKVRFAILLSLLFMAVIFPLSAVRLTVNPFLKSALVPGWGQISQGQNSGYAMLASEILFWSAKFYTDNEKDLRDRESYEFALKYAHINTGKYSAQYYRDLAKYSSSGFDAGGYNAMVRTTALDKYAYDPVAQQQYIDENKYSDEMGWQWDTTKLRKNYSSKRKNILELEDQAKVITGLVIANHIVSGIDMLRQRKRWHNATPSIGYYRHTPTFNLSMDL